MNIWLLDNTFTSIYLLDTFKSIIWTESYRGYGDFELYIPLNNKMIEIMSFIRNQRVKELDTYLISTESDQVMIIEEIEISTFYDNLTNMGRLIKLSGRSLESILDRRIVWKQTIFNGDFQNAIERLLNENLISPEIKDRKIPGFIFVRSTDPRIKELKADTQFTGDNLYEAINDLCEPKDVGFIVRLTESNQFAFQLYIGEDRSYDQTKNTYVIFSTKYENLVNSNFLEDVKELKNVTLVMGEDEGTTRRTYTVGSSSGLARRELYTDARDIQSEYYDDEGEQHTVSDEEYNASLKERGEKDLTDWKFIQTFEGEVEALTMFVYGKDFFKGDIVQVETDYGIQSKMRVIQMVRTQDENGISAYPVFDIIDGKED